MLYLTEADKALFDIVRDRNQDAEDRDRKIAKIQKDLEKNLKFFLQGDPRKSFGLTMSRVFLQKYDILKEKYFRDERPIRKKKQPRRDLQKEWEQTGRYRREVEKLIKERG